jgi:hypothetical protein
MPRSSSCSKSYSSPRTPLPSYPKYQSSPVIHIEQHKQGFFSKVFDGFAYGTGSSIAQNIFRKNEVVIKNENSSVPQSVIQSNESKEYVQCLKDTNNDKDACEHYLQNNK